MARQLFFPCVLPVWSDVEIVARLNGEEYLRTDAFPVVIPFYFGLIPEDKPGQITVDITTPKGTVGFRFLVTEQTILSHSMPLMSKRLIQSDDDYAAVEYILEHIRFQPNFQAWSETQENMQGNGVAVAMVDRIPFQRLLLEFMGEEKAIYELHDNPTRVARLLQLLGERHLEQVRLACQGPFAYIESPDNVDGQITSPHLFKKYCLPHFQQVTEIAHQHGKFYGSHLDGELKPLLDLMPATGLDVAESVTPAPMTQATIFDILTAWPDKPIVWGGIPSILLEAPVPEDVFRGFVTALINHLAPARRIILGVGDQVIGTSLIERVRYVSDYLEKFGWYPLSPTTI